METNPDLELLDYLIEKHSEQEIKFRLYIYERDDPMWRHSAKKKAHMECRIKDLLIKCRTMMEDGLHG
jgi:hypothetical protein